MEKFIEVYDNIIDPKLVNDIEKEIFEIPYHYTKTSTSIYDTIYTPIFFNLILSPDRQINSTSFYFLQVLYNFISKINFKIENLFLGRAYLQIPNKSIKIHPPHIDLDWPHLVCLYYVNDTDGDTIFYKDDKKTEIKRISPKKGRIAFFDGSIYHSSSTPTDKERFILNFSFDGKML